MSVFVRIEILIAHFEPKIALKKISSQVSTKDFSQNRIEILLLEP